MNAKNHESPSLRTTWTFDGCNAKVQEQLRLGWRAQSDRLESLLEPLGATRQRLKLFVHGPARPDAGYQMRAVLHLPTGVLVAEHGEDDPATALASVAEGLRREVQKHRQELHREHVIRFKSRHRAAVNAAASFLARDVEQGRREAFFELLRPMLGFLRQHAQWELHVLHEEKAVPLGWVTVDDLIDEVLVLAWDQFRRRPQGEPLDLWIIDLLHEVARQWSKEPPHLSLEDKAEPEPERSPEDEPGEWWLGDYERVPTLEAMVPGARGREAWEQMAADERRARVVAILAALPAERRQAFLLRSLEGFSTADISQVQGRTDSAVKKDIAAARKFLKQKLLEPASAAPARSA